MHRLKVMTTNAKCYHWKWAAT